MKAFAPILILFSFFTYSQPLVHEESHHIPVIENRFARVLNVVALRGDTTDFHIHTNDIAYFTIRGSQLWLQELNEEPRTLEIPTGWAGSNLTHSKTPLIHRFANIGRNDFQLIAVEVLSDKFSERAFAQLGKSLHEDERFSIQEIEGGVLSCEVPLVLMELTRQGEIVALDMIKANKELDFVNRSDSSQLIIIQFK